MVCWSLGEASSAIIQSKDAPISDASTTDDSPVQCVQCSMSNA